MRIRTVKSTIAVLAAAAGMAAFAASAQEQVRRQPSASRQPIPAIDRPAPTLAELKAGLDQSDRLAVLEAIHLGLSEVGDGQTYMWRRKTGKILGYVRPVRSVRDATCR
ncbi:MAG: hypothetical protein F9K44_13515, partial [Hyphomicrobiaceae bacterium]